MRFVAIDIGAGTQDILFFDSEEKLENAVKLVFPSPTKIFHNKIISLEKNIFISGNIIGGGPVVRALIKHIKKGYSVFITKQAALTVRDNLEEVIQDGFDVVEEVLNPDIIFKEIDIELLNFLNKKTNLNKPLEQIGIAVQDHGFVKGQSDRETRINFLKNYLKEGLKKAYYNQESDIPKNFTRWQSLKKDLIANGFKRYIIADTAVVAALGATYEIKNFPVVTVDAGNGHTFAAVVADNAKILGFFEHHTSMLNPKKVMKLIKLLIKGSISNEKIYRDGGHGAHIFEKYSFESLPIIVTGPNRNKLFGDFADKITFATPLGDSMITGPVGILMQQDLL
jgi:uncharacterized protein (DUF1786 family)